MSDMRRSVFFPKISHYAKRLNQTCTEELVSPHWPMFVKGCQKFFRMKLIRVKVMTGQVVPTVPVPWPQKEPHRENPPDWSAAKLRAGASQRPPHLLQTWAFPEWGLGGHSYRFISYSIMTEIRQKWLWTEQNHLQICFYPTITSSMSKQKIWGS